MFLVTAISFWLSGCAAVERVGISLLYRRADLPESQVVKNLFYGDDLNVVDSKHQLDLFLPRGTNWPLLIFVHGGGWNSGDKSLRVGGADVYGNIGRFFAANGVGVAVINYRLQPGTVWRGQVGDVAKAVTWVHARISEYHGNPQALFLMGHSAGAQLAAHVALNPKPLAEEGVSSNIICGVISVSGAGLDLSDDKTYELGQRFSYYEQRFRPGSSGNWQHEASPVTYIQTDAPPFLILFAGGEKDSLKRQSELLHAALLGQGVQSQVVKVPGESHSRMVLTLSRPDKTSASAILRFVHTTRCYPPVSIGPKRD